MKLEVTRLFSLIIIATLSLILFIGCGENKFVADTDSIYSVCEQDAADWAQNYDFSAPGTLTVYIDHGGLEKEPQVITDPHIVNAVFQGLNAIRLQKITVKGPMDFMMAPDEVTYSFTTNDGKKVRFSFLDHQYAVGDPIYSDGVLYSCTGTDGLFNVEGIKYVTAESDFSENSLFSFFDDAKISNFADLFYTEIPVSVSYTFNGEGAEEPVVLTDEDEITAVFLALSEISILDNTNTMYADNEHVFEFIFSDGSSIAFCFNGNCFEYYNNVYTLENNDDFQDLLKLFSQNTCLVFYG